MRGPYKQIITEHIREMVAMSFKVILVQTITTVWLKKKSLPAVPNHHSKKLFKGE
jgi:hypothetical protein